MPLGLAITPKAQIRKNRYIGLHQNEKLLYIKGHYLQSKKANLQKILANHISEKGLIFKVYKQLLNSFWVRLYSTW